MKSETIEFVDKMNYEELSRWGAFIECLEFILNEAKKRGIDPETTLKKINSNRISEYIESKSDYYTYRMIKEDQGCFI